ncbi:gliding motility-associated C-terminal domain-containing protein [Aureibaculum sp. A20]|uniref:Gliding motility-associated C-terminal domain-containing protein n=1 Tax=Aureibaculum flavum TaxID=2795986 RepID=A0ABS0WN66_9FLAO|nr:gliding motility-associated C-terminal domain-containing protein [Aureibaculum flavum]MBJ2173384.1 gliding motility-associated C-terminal domain-containing protein [Aureibaculum flavum]
MVTTKLIAHETAQVNRVQLFENSKRSKVYVNGKQSVSKKTKSINGSPEFDIKIVSDYKTAYGCSAIVGTNNYTFTNVADKTDNGENFASDIIVDLGASFNEAGFDDANATLEEALNSSANLTKLYINGMLISNRRIEINNGRFRVKIANISDEEIAGILGFKDLDNDGVYDDLEEGGSFKVTTITSVNCASNEKGYNAARVLFNNKNGTNLKVHAEKDGYVLANKIEGNNNTLTFPNAIDYDVPFGIEANATGLFDPRAYTGCKNQYTELVLSFSKKLDFSKVTFSDVHNRTISHVVEGNNTVLRIKLPLLNGENQDLTHFKVNGLQAECYSNSTINVDWVWNYVCEDCSTCKVEWLSGVNTIKTNSCVPFDLGVEKEVNDLNPYIGDEVILTTSIINNSDVIAENIVVTDLLQDGYEYVSSETEDNFDSVKGEWKLSSLIAGTKKTLKVRVKILETGTYENTATLADYSGGNDEISANNQSTIIVSPITPKISLAQESVFNDENKDGYAQVGETISYKFTVNNIGNTVLSNILVSDPKLNVSGVAIANLTSNTSDTDTFSAVYFITQEDINAKEFYNKAEVIAYDIKNKQIKSTAQDINNLEPLDSNCKGCSMVILPQLDALSLIKTFSIQDTNLDGVVGNLKDEIIVHYTVFNTGNVTLSNVSIDYTRLGKTKSVVVSEILQPSEMGQWSLTDTIFQQDIDRGFIERSAIARAELPLLDDSSVINSIEDVSDAGTDSFGEPIENPNAIESPNADGSFDNNPTNDPIIIQLPSDLDLSITKEVNNPKPVIDEEVIFTIKVLNKGNITVKNILVDEVIPNGYEYLSHSATSGAYSYYDGEWSIPILNFEEESSLAITVKVLQEGDYLNTARIISYEGIADSDESNNEATAEASPTCLIIYNEFSPNNDGANDTFEIDCIQNYKNNSLAVFNRWGNIVYKKTNYDNSWGGINNSGKALTSGTYYYVLKLGDGSKDKTGWLFINR